MKTLDDLRSPTIRETERPDAGVAARRPLTGDALLVLVAALAAAWLAAGSVGLLGHALRHVLTWLALGVALAVAWPGRSVPRTSRWGLFGAIGFALLLTASTLPAVNVLAVALVLVLLAACQEERLAAALRVAAAATVALALLRIVAFAVPTVWLIADGLGGLLGRLAGMLTGQPLRVGMSFGGIDFLVVMGVVYIAWLRATPAPRRSRAAWGALAILGAHFLYLAVLAHTSTLEAALPVYEPPIEASSEGLPPWRWHDTVRAWLPWGLPALAALLHAAVAVLLFRWSPPAVDPGGRSSRRAAKRGHAAESPAGGKQTSAARRYALWLAPSALAVVAAATMTLSVTPVSLEGKDVLAYGRGHLDWRVPEHDRYGAEGAGMYGLLRPLVESLGGRFHVSNTLTRAELARADVLLLIHPVAPWDRAVLERIDEYVRQGGAVLLAAGTQVGGAGAQSAFAEVLAGTAIRVRRDSATPLSFGWRQNTAAMAHAAVLGLDDRRAELGQLSGASLSIGWPARPLLVGRWGYSDPGSDAAEHGKPRFDAGERLGDLVLAAEQAYGKGRILVLGDATPLANEFSFRGYEFTGRLLGLLARRGTFDLLSGGRQLLALLALGGLALVLYRRPDPLVQGAALAALALTLLGASSVTARAASAVPDAGRIRGENYDVAYITASHLEPTGGDSVHPDGIGDFALTLARSGYLPLALREITPARLAGANLLVTIAPARPYTAAERRAVREFVERGGDLIVMVGAEEARPAQGLLDEFGLSVTPSPIAPGDATREPAPWGYRRTRIDRRGEIPGQIRLYSGWAVTTRDRQPLWRITGVNGETCVVVQEVKDRRGEPQGRVVLIGDTCFAMNKNLEHSDTGKSPHELENVYFWRFLLGSVLSGREEWLPPDLDAKAESEKPQAE